jgi:predicted aconitase with swiveling domain
MIAGHAVSKGVAVGEVLISDTPISFLGGIDPETGVIIEKNHPKEGVSIADRVFLFPNGKGSTVGSYVIYSLKKKNVAPCAMINISAETIVAVGAIISDIPLVDRLEQDPFAILNDGDIVEVNGTAGCVRVITETRHRYRSEPS